MRHASQPTEQMFYSQKILAFLQATHSRNGEISPVVRQLAGDLPELLDLEAWWHSVGDLACRVSSADFPLETQAELSWPSALEIRHPISGEARSLAEASGPNDDESGGSTTKSNILGRAWSQLVETAKTDVERSQLIKQFFWWCWRFYPQEIARSPDSLLYPAHVQMPDSTWHSSASTVSALAGSLDTDKGCDRTPYLLLFTFSPVQEFIKASRKFLDFWAGSYLLHYLSAKLCWYVAQQYGPDAVITPSLWEQPIIDAFLIQQYPAFEKFFPLGKDPVSQFRESSSTSLETAGFPNIISVVVPGKTDAVALGKDLARELKLIWQEMATKVRKRIENRFEEIDPDEIWSEIGIHFKSQSEPNPYKKELSRYRCWEWQSLWAGQIDNTWETYYSAIPLGHPEKPLEPSESSPQESWIFAQNELAQPREPIPSPVEEAVHTTLNVGLWWGSLQLRLGQAIQVVKNTRTWQVPVSPGERSSVSGQLSVLHPRFNYKKFPEGRGMLESSNRLFWQAMAVAFPGLFNGAEKLNAVEVTKRMAWKFGGIAESLGLENEEYFQEPYENQIRFPNLCSIAAARFALKHPDSLQQYWSALRHKIRESPELSNEIHDRFCSITRRPFHIRQTDQALNSLPEPGNGYNGVMFSNRWLEDDLGLKGSAAGALRQAVAKTLQEKHFGDSNPVDWWVLILADGDGMGQYLSGRRLQAYEKYLIQPEVAPGVSTADWEDFLKKRKRMGPTTHIGLNRALLDFSNCLIPHITENRCCGRVIYSGGDDVMVALPLADLPQFLLSQRAAWCGDVDPESEFQSGGGYWTPAGDLENVPRRPLFTMGAGATMSLGVVIAHQSVPLPTVLETLWNAEKERAKALLGESRKGEAENQPDSNFIPDKDGLCFKVIYGSGNISEALMKGHLLNDWWAFVKEWPTVELEPVLLRLAEDISKHGVVTENLRLMSKIAGITFDRREQDIPKIVQSALVNWLNAWEIWAWKSQQTALERGQKNALGTAPEDLANLMRFTAFWISRQRQELDWTGQGE